MQEYTKLRTVCKNVQNRERNARMYKTENGMQERRTEWSSLGRAVRGETIKLININRTTCIYGLPKCNSIS